MKGKTRGLLIDSKRVMSICCVILVLSATKIKVEGRERDGLTEIEGDGRTAGTTDVRNQDTHQEIPVALSLAAESFSDDKSIGFSFNYR